MAWHWSFQRIGAQARPSVELYFFDDGAMEKVGKNVLINVIDK